MRIIDIINGPWAITPEMLTEIRSIYAKHMRGEKIEKALLEQLAAANGAKKPAEGKRYDVVNGSAVIPVEGVIAKKMNIFMAICGGASTQMVEQAIRQALADDAVDQIVLLVDSPGGTVDGTFELSNFIYESRGRKPIVAYTDGAMYSAAYAIGSAADKIYVSSDSVGVGSIGIVAAHEDWSKAEEKMGVKTTEIYAGKYKRIASQVQPLSQEGYQSIKDEVDYLYEMFVDTVARNRGVSVETVLQKMSTDVKSAFIGQQAIDAGLVDGFATMDMVISRQIIIGAALRGRPQSEAAQSPAGVAAPEPIAAEEDIVDLKELKEKHPDLYQSVLAEGKAAGIEDGKKAGAEAELERIKSVKAVAMPGHEALVEKLMFDGKTGGPEAAMAVVAAEKSKREKHLADYKADGKDVQATVVDGAAADAAKAAEAAKKGQAADKSLPVEERAKAAWDGDAAIRTEFGGSYAAFEAWFKASDAGLVKTIGKK